MTDKDMTDNAAVRRLHDKATRSEPLTAGEQVELAEWYTRQDTEEVALLDASSQRLELDALRHEAGNALMPLQVAAQ